MGGAADTSQDSPFVQQFGEPETQVSGNMGWDRAIRGFQGPDGERGQSPL